MLKQATKHVNKKKEKLRKKFLILRKKKFFDVSKKQLQPLISYIKQKKKIKKKFLIAFYYPSNYEINVLKIMKYLKKMDIVSLLPIIKNRNELEFASWNEKDILKVNNFGIPEPIKQSKLYFPDILLVPLLAFDKYKNRLGYGKGYYDKYLNHAIKHNNQLDVIGIAFSFQKYKKLPISPHDYKLSKVFTEKGFIK